MGPFTEKGDFHPFYNDQDIEEVHAKAKTLLDYLLPRSQPGGKIHTSLHAMSDHVDMSPDCVKYAVALLLHYGFLSSATTKGNRMSFSFPEG